MAMSDGPLLKRHGWTLLFHPCFQDQLASLIAKVGKVQQRAPAGWRGHRDAKLLAALRHLILEKIPADPTDPSFRQGDTLGPAYRHWFRAKLFQQYRLFFRYHSKTRIIAFGWINDDISLRAYDSANDAYLTFKRMLDNGHPPDDWETLIAACSTMPRDD